MCVCVFMSDALLGAPLLRSEWVLTILSVTSSCGTVTARVHFSDPLQFVYIRDQIALRRPALRDFSLESLGATPHYFWPDFFYQRYPTSCG